MPRSDSRKPDEASRSLQQKPHWGSLNCVAPDLKHITLCPVDRFIAHWPVSTKSFGYLFRGSTCQPMSFDDLGASEDALRFRRMIGRGGVWRATVSKLARAKVEAYPVPDALGVNSVSRGYASSAGASADLAAFTAAAMSADVIPLFR